MRRSIAVGALAAAVLGLSAGPAYAGSHDDWPKGSGEWSPFPAEYYDQSFTFEACGGEMFTISSGDERNARHRETELEHGRVLSEYHGPETIDLTRESDGKVIDELDVGGYSRSLTWEMDNGNIHALDQLFGGSLALPFVQSDSAQLEEALGTDLAWWGDDDDSITLESIVDPETGAHLKTLDVEIRADYVDLCKSFDKLAAKHGGDDDHHHD
jgi:hypothetical protein